MKIAKNIVLFLSISLVVGLIYISSFNVYQTDDFIFAHQTQKLGLFKSMTSFYLNWGGRYFGYSFNSFIPVSYDKFGILPKIYPIFLITSLIAVFVLNIQYYFKYSLWKSLLKGFLLFFFCAILLVSLSEHFFWITGANIYFLPTILGGILVYCLGRFNDSARREWHYLSLFLIIILMGSNEIIALLLIGILLFYYIQKKTRDRFTLLIIGCIFILISFCAPGNFLRLPQNSDSFFLKWTKRIGLLVVNEIYILTKIFIIIPLFVKIFENEISIIYKKVNIKKALILYAISILPLLFLSYILNGIGRPFESIIFYSLLISSLLAFSYKKLLKKIWWISLLMIISPKLIFFPEKYSAFNINYNLNDFFQEIFITDLKGYDMEINKRIEKIKNCKNDTIYLDKIKNKPKILYFDELSTKGEEKKYVNDQLEKYFNKKSLYVKE